MTIAPNVAAIVPMMAGRFFALVSLVLKTCTELSVTACPEVAQYDMQTPQYPYTDISTTK